MKTVFLLKVVRASDILFDCYHKHEGACAEKDMSISLIHPSYCPRSFVLLEQRSRASDLRQDIW